MLTHEDLKGDPEVARRVMIRARSIAPCLVSVEDEAKEDAIAILNGVIDELPEPGERRVKSQRIGPAGVDYSDVASAFSADDISSLRALCAATTGGLPLGSFPPPSRVVARLWPEDCT